MNEQDRQRLEKIEGKIDALQASADNNAFELTEIKVVLKGYDGQNGLVNKVNNHAKSLNKLWIVVAFIVASMGGSTYGIIKLLVG